MEKTNSSQKALLQRVKQSVNKHEWTKELDEFLVQSVLRNYFNFDQVSLEINEESKNQGLNFGATDVFTNEKCRLRWSYLHLKVFDKNEYQQHIQRKQGKEVRYKVGKKDQRETTQSTHHPSQIKHSRSSIEVQNSKSQQQQQKPSASALTDPQQLLQQKSFDSLTKIVNPKSMGDIERQVWKSNITQNERRKKDYLDVSAEDFSKNKTVSIEGKVITPSNFNIFRDSLRQTSQQLLKTLNENLPDMNLKELEESAGEETEEEVLPLDFRTALIEEDNKIVIQAKPLSFKTEEDLIRENQNRYLEEGKSGNFESVDSYLEAVKKEPFKDDNVILIDPDINIKEKFEKIDLLCNVESRMNNAVNAPVKPADQLNSPKSNTKPKPQTNKHYDTDTDNEEVKQVKPENLDFNNILKQWGVTDINKLIGTSSDDESKRKKQQFQKSTNEVKTQQQPKADDKSAQSRIGLIQSIMQENRQAQKAREDKDALPQSIDELLASLQDNGDDGKQQQEEEEDSDVAPMSALVDMPTKEELEQQQKKQIENSVKLAASSEDEGSGNEKKQQSDKEEQESEQEQIDTSSKNVEEEKTRKTKTVTYKGVRIESGDEQQANDKSSEDDDSADDYFNQQRKTIRQKLLGTTKQQEFEKEDLLDEKDVEEGEGARNWGDDMDDFDKLMENSVSDAKRLQEETERKARDEVERIRRQRLAKQEQMLKEEQEKKRRDREELMEKLKKQDEERKRRKKEEKDRKEKEKEIQKRLEEEKQQREEVEQERKRMIEFQKKLEEERKKKDVEDNDRRKKNFESSIRKIWNGSDIPCLFDSKIAYSKLLYSIPVELEKLIQSNEVSSEDLIFRRYKTLIVPTDGILEGQALFEIIEFFLRYSTLKKVENDSNSNNESSFPFKCIGLTMTMAYPPFNKVSLSPVNTNKQQSAYRVLALLFDTQDYPLTKHNFNETLKNIYLRDIVSEDSLKQVHASYKSFLQKLAFDYFSLNKIKEFPYAINTDKSPLLEFINQKDLELDTISGTLSQVAFFTEYAVQDEVIPMSTKESWDFIRRYPTFYAYNPNNKSYTKLDNKDRVVNKYNNYNYENVCVIFKDITYGQMTETTDYEIKPTKSTDSLQYFLKKAISKNGLEISGMRMIYLDQEQTDLYSHLFNEKLNTHLEDHEKESMLAFFIRGVDAISKVEQIIGHFNPELARKTNERSVRSYFGKDKEHNCVLKMFASQKKNLSELIFWFGGRVYSEADNIHTTPSGIVQEEIRGNMYMVVPPKINKQFLFLSPLITQSDLNKVLSELSHNGVTVLDIQRVDYNKLQYEGSDMQNFNKDMCYFTVRGSTYSVQVGFILKITRENLTSQMANVIKRLNKKLTHINRQYGDIFHMTKNDKEYKILKQILRKSQFRVSYYKTEDLAKQQKQQRDEAKKSDTERGKNYDSEDSNLYKNLDLYAEKDFKSTSLKKTGTLITQKPMKQGTMQKKVDPYSTSSFVCFIKMNVFKKQVIGDILNILLKQCGFELLGVKIIDAKKDIYIEPVPLDIKKTIKSIAYKFYEHSSEDLKLRKKIIEFKTLALVLRGRNIEHTIDTVYNREKCIFNNDEVGLYEGSPSVLFLTNNTVLEPLFDFILSTRLIKLYNDLSASHEHLMDSPVFSYMLSHNNEPSSKAETIGTTNIVEIKQKELLIESESNSNQALSACVCVVKPNQPFNVVMRTLKSIANNEEMGLNVQNVQIVRYSDSQLELLFKHDIQYDEAIPQHKKESLRQQYKDMFNNSKNPAVQILVTGSHAITKVQQLIGNKDPKHTTKDTLRSFYGVDRFDNAYFVSENFSESLLERDFLFLDQAPPTLLQSDQIMRQIKARNPPPVLSQSIQINSSTLFQQHPELALILIAPKLVSNNDFVYVIDDFYRSKYNICGVQRATLEREDVDFLFADLAPRFFNTEVMWTNEFSTGPSVLLVLEKEKAVNEVSDLVGRIDIKTKTDFDKPKKKQSSFQMFNYGNDSSTLIQEYGAYIFNFPNVGLNQKKILRFFTDLPNSHHFYMESV